MCLSEMEQHFLHSSFRESLVEHLFVGELLKISWQRGDCALEVAKPEVDNRGYDLIAELSGVVRHLQLKTARVGATASGQKLHVALAEKPSGCIVWIYFDEATLALGPFFVFGGSAGTPLPDISDLKVAKHTKANAQGVKAERPAVRTVPKGKFERIETAEALYDWLFIGDT